MRSREGIDCAETATAQSEFPTPWTPILTGRLADRARSAVAAIADELPRHPPVQRAPGDRVNLASGAAGIALFHAYAGDWDRAGELLERALDEIVEMSLWPALHTGWVGVAWAIAHLQGDAASVSGVGVPDSNAHASQLALEHVRRAPRATSYDLINGLVGIAVYALAQAGCPDSELILEEIVTRLEERATPAHAGLTIVSPPNQACPGGSYNAGVAHGIPGLLGVLGSVPGSRARHLRDGFAAWLRSIAIAGAGVSVLPYWIDLQRPDHRSSSRAAWCYGDPGAAVALLRGARAAGDPALEDFALTLARAAAARALASSGVEDSGLCHGAAGLLHIFNRLYHATGEEVFRTAAVAWAEQTLALRGCGGIAGYRVQHEDGWLGDPGLLCGAAGVGLALLAGLGDVEPGWDAVLICDVPPRRPNEPRASSAPALAPLHD